MSRPGRLAHPRVTFRDPPPDDYDDDDDDEEVEDADAEEQERLLSEKFGEAGEDAGRSSSGRKRGGGGAGGETDRDIEEELAGAVGAAQGRRKKARPSLTAADLAGGPRGLERIRNEFPDRVKYRKPPGARARLAGRRGGGGAPSRDRLKDQELDAAAAYGRSLMGAYRSFCRDLFPSLAFEDVLNRIETLGSKKEVKSYVQVMREDVRKRYLEGIYGRDKAESLLHELEHGLSRQGHEEDVLLHLNSRAAAAAARGKEDEEKLLEEDGDAAPVASEPPQPHANPYEARLASKNTNREDASEEMGANLEEGAEDGSAGSNSIYVDTDQATEEQRENDQSQEGSAVPDLEATTKNDANKRQDEEEVEATFDDVTGGNSSKSSSKSSGGSDESAEQVEEDTSAKKAEVETNSEPAAQVEAPGRDDAENGMEPNGLSSQAKTSEKYLVEDAAAIPEPSRAEEGSEKAETSEEPLIEDAIQDEEGAGRSAETVGTSATVPEPSQAEEGSEGVRLIADASQDNDDDNADMTQETATAVPTMTAVEHDEGDLPTEEEPAAAGEDGDRVGEEGETGIFADYSQVEESEERLVVDATQDNIGLTVETLTVVPTQEGGGISQLSMDY